MTLSLVTSQRQEVKHEKCVCEAGPGGVTNLCTHFHRPVQPRHCGSSPACIAGSAGL